MIYIYVLVYKNIILFTISFIVKDEFRKSAFWYCCHSAENL